MGRLSEWAEWSPKDAYVLIPGTCDYVILHGKRDFTAIINITDFNTGLGGVGGRRRHIVWIIQVGPTESNDPLKTELSLAGGKDGAEGDLKEIPGMEKDLVLLLLALR